MTVAMKNTLKVYYIKHRTQQHEAKNCIHFSMNASCCFPYLNIILYTVN